MADDFEARLIAVLETFADGKPRDIGRKTYMDVQAIAALHKSGDLAGRRIDHLSDPTEWLDLQITAQGRRKLRDERSRKPPEPETWEARFQRRHPIMAKALASSLPWVAGAVLGFIASRIGWPP